jgi:hypothetical protein
MKKFIRYICNWIFASIWLLVLWVSAMPINTVMAETGDCNRFWASCHVSDIHTIRTNEGPSSRLLDTVKNTINRILWFLATIALCICIYWGFKMLLSGWDSKWFDAWKTVLKNAAIWLAIILLAWMIVSVVFRFVGTLSWWNQTQIEEVNPI